MRSIFFRHGYALGIVALVILTAPLGVSSRGLWVGDETREAAIAKEMASSGNFLETRLAGQMLLEKPPFFYATVASSIRLANGVTRFSVRLPSILFSALTLLCAGAAALLLFSPRAGLLSAVICSTTYLFTVNAHDCVVDACLTAFVSLGFLAFVLASRRAGCPRWDLAFGLAAAGALLAKGFVGPVLLCLLTIPFWWLSPERRSLRQSVGIGALLVPCVALLVWGGASYASGGLPTLSEALLDQQLGRFLGLSSREYSHHRSPFYFYLASLPGILFPWVITLPAAARHAIQARRHRPMESTPLALAMAVLLALVFLSCAGTKRTVYFLPVVPIVAILVGSFFETKVLLRSSRISGGLWAQFGVLAFAAVAVPLLPTLAAVGGHPLSLAGVGLIAGIAFAAVGGAFLARRSAPQLVALLLIVATGSLVLLDRYALPLLDRDRPTREFFARVKGRLSPLDRVYSYNLNENVLGRACLDLRSTPIAESNPAQLIEKLAAPGVFLLAESTALGARDSEWIAKLESLEEGRAGNRPIALYRFRSALVDDVFLESRAGRTVGAPPVRAFSSLREPGFQRFAVALLPPESKSLADAVRKEESTDQNREKNRGNNGGNLCPGCLADPEGLARNELPPDQETLDDEVEDQGKGQAQEDAFPPARETDRIFDVFSEEESESRPQEAIPEGSGQVAQQESPEHHASRSCGEKDDRTETVQIAGQKDDAVAVAVEGVLDLLNLPRGENPSQKAVAFQAPAKQRAKSVKNRVGNDNASQRRSDH